MMKWFSRSYWWSLWMGLPIIRAKQSTSTPSSPVQNTLGGSKKPARRGRPLGSKNKAKSTRTVSPKSSTQTKSKSGSKK